MNKQEAIKHLEEWVEVISIPSRKEAVEMAIAALQDDWIPVSERLPKEYDQYLCYCEGGECYVYWLDNEPWVEETVEKERIIAWQPLPEPYKGGNTEWMMTD